MQAAGVAGSPAVKLDPVAGEAECSRGRLQVKKKKGEYGARPEPHTHWDTPCLRVGGESAANRTQRLRAVPLMGRFLSELVDVLPPPISFFMTCLHKRYLEQKATKVEDGFPGSEEPCGAKGP